MPRLEYPLLLALASLSFIAQAQELPPIVLPTPPVVAVDIGPESHAAENSYPNYRCENWDCCHQWWCATWYTRVELLALGRDHDPQNRAIVQTTGGTSVFNTNDIDFELTLGVSTLLGHRIDGLTAFELSYFGANQWNEERFVAGPANLNLAGDLGALFDAFNSAISMEISLRSEMHNAEINYLRDLDGFTLLAGFRFFNWLEQLNIHATDSGDLEENDYRVELSNNLLGGQLGARVVRYFHGLEIDFTGKAGIFGNQATQAQGFTVLDGSLIVRNVAATEGVVSFLGDLNISANCPITRVWRMRGGYNLLYASSIALAANQLDFSFTSTSGERIRQDSDVFLHGFNIGLEAIW